ncbi:MAG: polysaccharide deacetylase family protein [Acidobacteria bacterium]|nr:polysaccharide deacetylase family protein [Acidobacteriota bacterium]
MPTALIIGTLGLLMAYMVDRSAAANTLSRAERVAREMAIDVQTPPMEQREMSPSQLVSEPNVADSTAIQHDPWQAMQLPTGMPNARPRLVLDPKEIPDTDTEAMSEPVEPPDSVEVVSQRSSPAKGLARHFTGENPYTKYHLEEVTGRTRRIVLTFDGDHLANCVDPIMAVLAEKNVRATVFLTGQFIQRYPEKTLAILGSGHEIGNHTWSHRHLTQYGADQTHRTLPDLNPDILERELRQTSEIFESVTQQQLKPFWRAPYGEHNKSIRSWAYASGYFHIGWSRGFDSLDWLEKQDSRYYWRPDALEKRLLQKLDRDPMTGKIILFHLGSRRPDQDRPYHMLADFIDKARARGYQFSTVSDCLEDLMASNAVVTSQVRHERQPVSVPEAAELQ